MAAEVTIRGLRELNRALARLPDKLAKRVVARGTAAAAAVLVAEAKSRAAGAFTQRTGAIRRNIAYVRGKKPTKLTGRYVVGVRHLVSAWKGNAAKALSRIRMRGGMRKALREAGIDVGQVARLSGRRLGQLGLNPYYWRFLELGTKHIPKGRYSFLVPALAGARGKMLKRMIEVWQKTLADGVREARR